jgi:cell wall-associated NlpC family hydrolase
MLSHARHLALAAIGCALVALTGCASGAVRGPAAFPGAPTIAPPRPHDPADPVPPMVSAVMRTALTYLGTPYRFGGDDPADGFDCSGLVRYTFTQHQIDLPRTVEDQYLVGRPVDDGALQAGDLVFFSTVGRGATHVGIVVDPSALTFIHAPNSTGVVRIERLDASYWRTRFVGARRVI